jgi:hypothetical protein
MKIFMLLIIIGGFLFYGLKDGQIKTTKSTKNAIDSAVHSANELSNELLGEDTSDSLKVTIGDITSKASTFLDSVTSQFSKKSQIAYLLKETTCSNLKKYLLMASNVGRRPGDEQRHKQNLIDINNLQISCLKELKYEILDSETFSDSTVIKGLLKPGEMINNEVVQYKDLLVGAEGLKFKATLKNVLGDTIVKTICVYEISIHPFASPFYNQKEIVEKGGVKEFYKCSM